MQQQKQHLESKLAASQRSKARAEQRQAELETQLTQMADLQLVNQANSQRALVLEQELELQIQELARQELELQIHKSELAISTGTHQSPSHATGGEGCSFSHRETELVCCNCGWCSLTWLERWHIRERSAH